MNYLIFHDNIDQSDQSYNIQRLINTGEGITSILLKEITQAYHAFSSQNEFSLAIPNHWPIDDVDLDFPIVKCSESLPLSPLPVAKNNTDQWVLISNARYVTNINQQWFTDILSEMDVGVTCVNIDPELTAFREKIRISSQGDLIGIRRHYDNSVRINALPKDWPPHICIKINKFNKLNFTNGLPLDFSDFIAKCRQASLNVQAVSLAGAIQDLNTEQGVLAFATNALNSNRGDLNLNSTSGHVNIQGVQYQGRFFGQVITGQNVQVEQGAIVVGPVVLGDNVKIEKDAIVRSSIVGSNLTIPQKYHLENRIALVANDLQTDLTAPRPLQGKSYLNPNDSRGRKRFYFRTWRWFNYGGVFKRFADIVFSIMVLLLFLPVLPLLAMIIKISYPGPIFFGHARQGRYGKEFKCIKFRTMMVGADDIQSRLRIKNQVDGPQFKMDDDPRVTPVGKFLRDTCIDEIPQFINVLLGQMSVVGPRPSPESENAFCAYWRDARLSVRPGITGMWQVCRTREDGQDFQEWVLNDTKYVKKLSPGLDLWICWKTALQLVSGFMGKF